MRQRCVVVMLSLFICAAGTAQAQTVWEDYPGNPVLGSGNPGSWDEDGRGATTVLFDGSIFHMWFLGIFTGGWPAEVGHATSPDGLPPWTIDPGNPVLTRGAPGTWDDEALVISAVIHDGSQFHMWYSGWHDNRERIGYATSPDGSDWTKYSANPVIDVGPPGSWYDWQVRPGQVIADGGTYKMWFSGLQADGSVRIGYAVSSDGIVWYLLKDPVLEPGEELGAWDEFRVVNPSVVTDGSSYHMLYTGTRMDGGQEIGKIGYASSSNGIHWVKHRENPVFETADGLIFLNAVIFDGVTFYIWYSHGSPKMVISYATSGCCAVLFGDDFESGDTSVWSNAVP